MADMTWLTDILESLAANTKASITTSIPGDPNWDDINKLMGMDTQMNRFDRQGAFSSWDWTEDPVTGRFSQTQNMGPEMQGGRDRLFDRVGGMGFDPYASPEQFNSLLDGKMANQMGRQNLLTQDPNLQREFGQGVAQQRPPLV
jgi:hypothetical protein